MNETPIDATPMNAKQLKLLAGGREADRRAEAAAAALAAAAADEGLLDVAIGVTGTPVGELLLAVTPRGLAYVAFDDEERDELLERLARELSPRILEHPASSDQVRPPARRVLRGRRRRFELKLDRRLMRGIAKDVLAETARVPFGRTTTYGAIADKIGRPRASRAVGNALGSEPDPDRGAVPPGAPRRRRRRRLRRRTRPQAPAPPSRRASCRRRAREPPRSA